MKIVVLDGYTLNPGDLNWDRIAKLGNFKVYDRTAPDEIIERIGDSEIVFVNKTPITAAALNSCPSIRFIDVLATGFNVVDIESARQHGVLVANIPTYGTDAVAQYVFALLLEICHHVAIHDAAVKNGEWASQTDFCFWKNPLIELAGKTMGIIGFGRIGQATAKIAKAFGMNVLAYDLNPELAAKSGIARGASIDECFSGADVISLHCPLTPETEGIINSRNISKMKPGVILINTSRGGLVNEYDLAAALDDGKIYAAAADVVSTEPIKPDNPLLKAKNIIITPHMAWAPKESRQRLMDIAADNLEAFLKGEPINIVN